MFRNLWTGVPDILRAPFVASHDGHERFDLVMPQQTVHVQTMAMGHHLLTLNAAWSVANMDGFFGDQRASAQTGPAQRPTMPP